ncbi:hypothetical protein FRC07_009665 [Ceratobasidium sp. 392]|nr:hypothetical protein FRC07_009665 [Ceratobasidium sp. 392]
MAPSAPKSNKLAKKDTKREIKEKIFHPQSRKAGQLERAQLRKNKLTHASSKRSKNLTSKDVAVMTLPEIHEIIKTVWLARHDSLLEVERAQRRPGRPQSARELALLEMKLQDEEVYRTGLTWETRSHDPAYLHLLRTVRVSSSSPDSLVVEHVGAQEVDAQKQQKAEEEKAKVDAANRAASRQEAARAAKDVSKMDIDTPEVS